MPLKLKRKRNDEDQEPSGVEKNKGESSGWFSKIKRTFKRNKTTEDQTETKTTKSASTKTSKSVTFNKETLIRVADAQHEEQERQQQFMTPINPKNIVNFFTPGTAGLTPGGYVLTPDIMIPPEKRRFFFLNETLPFTESRNMEFKTGGGMYPIQILPEHVRKYGSGFLNSSGGVLMAGVLDDGVVKGITCNSSRRRKVEDSVAREFSTFTPKIGRSHYELDFIPVAYQLTPYQRRYGGNAIEFMPDVFVMELRVKCGELGEIYEDGLHQVYMRRDGGVEGPLAPLQIKEIVITKYLQLLEQRKSGGRPAILESEDNTSKRRRPNLSPIKLDL